MAQLVPQTRKYNFYSKYVYYTKSRRSKLEEFEHCRRKQLHFPYFFTLTNLNLTLLYVHSLSLSICHTFFLTEALNHIFIEKRDNKVFFISAHHFFAYKIVKISQIEFCNE